MRKIKGLYKKDDNFITIFAGDEMYQIARNSGEWVCLTVGSLMANGYTLTRELFDSWSKECKDEGTFEVLDE